jgi:hypothetical protein
MDPKTQQSFSATQTVNVTSDVANVHMLLLPGITIPVNLHLEKTRSDSSYGQSQIFFGSVNGVRSRGGENVPARVTLSSSAAASEESAAAVKNRRQQVQYSSDFIEGAEGHTQAVRNVPSGLYSVEIFPNGPYYVQSARSGSVDLQTQDLAVTPGGSVQPIDVVLRDDAASLTGTVSSDRKGVAAFVLAVPAGNPAHAQITFAGSQGEFQFGLLAPGEYQLLAVDRADDWEYRNPEVLRKFLSGARELVLGANQSATIKLELAQIAEAGP